MYRTGNTPLVRISGYSHSGEGVGRWEGKPVFVPLAARGETIRCKIEQEKRQLARGKLLEVVEPAPWRVTPSCPVYQSCGGCQLQHLSYPEQLYFKREQVRAALERIGGLKGIEVNPVLGMKDPWHYRHTARFHVKREEGGVKIGYLSPHSHELVEVGHCPLLPRQFYPLLDMIRGMLDEIATGRPFPVEQLVLRQGYASGEQLVLLICRREPGIDPNMGAELAQAVPGCTGVVALIAYTAKRSHHAAARKQKPGGLSPHERRGKQPAKETVLIDDAPREAVIYGRDYYLERIAGTSFRVPATAFFQNNPLQAEKLVALVREYTQSTQDHTLMDLYCGVGLFSLALASGAKTVTGIEGNPAAVAAARQNAGLNGLDNTTFYQGEVEKVLSGLTSHPDTLLLDPPRSGSTPGTLNQITRLSPGRIVYISCNPATLARDLVFLVKGGYRIETVRPVDMFPHTSHVECVVSLKRKHSR